MLLLGHMAQLTKRDRDVVLLVCSLLKPQGSQKLFPQVEVRSFSKRARPPVGRGACSAAEPCVPKVACEVFGAWGVVTVVTGEVFFGPMISL